MPSDLSTLNDVEVGYEELPGWQSDISGARSWSDLPDNAQKYIRCPPPPPPWRPSPLRSARTCLSSAGNSHALPGLVTVPDSLVSLWSAGGRGSPVRICRTVVSGRMRPACGVAADAAFCFGMCAASLERRTSLHGVTPPSHRGACRRIEELVGVQCTWIGVGPGREAMVVQDSKWIQ